MKVKVAILDTGVFFDQALRSERYGKQLAECRSWCNQADASRDDKETSFEDDSDGHGTQSAATFMDVAPKARLYVAKIFEGRQANRQGYTITANEITQQRIANVSLQQ
jgi:hypothetical protein